MICILLYFYMLVNTCILNIRKCKVWIGVKFLLLNFILLIIPKEEITKLCTVLFLPPSCNSCTNDHTDSCTLHYITGPVCLPSSDRSQMEPSRHASGRNELLQFADRCNKLLEVSELRPPLSSQRFPVLIFPSWPLARPVLQFFLLRIFLWLPSSESSWSLWQC